MIVWHSFENAKSIEFDRHSLVIHLKVKAENLKTLLNFELVL